MRLDVFLTDKGLTKSRSSAAECIKSGLVSVNGQTSVKASTNVSESDDIVLLGKPHNYVGRGGLKIEHALDHFRIDVTGLRAIDIGASTGGFTDCLLQRGAASVFAVDSGHDQLDPMLLKNPAVTSLEGFNARNLTPEIVGYKADIAVSDVSFISQTLIIESAASVLKDGGIYVCLVKPQFECGVSALSKNGIVKDKKQYRHAINKVADAGVNAGLSIAGLTRSPIAGGDGNREFLLYMINDGHKTVYDRFINDMDEVCQ